MERIVRKDIHRGGLLALALSACVAAPATAQSLIYEGFDYTLGETLDSKSGGTGWAVDSQWAPRDANSTNQFTIVDGLSFADIITTGNAVQAPASAPFKIVYRDVDALPADGQTLWISYLFRPDTTLDDNARLGLRHGLNGGGSGDSLRFRLHALDSGAGTFDPLDGSKLGSASYAGSPALGTGEGLFEDTTYLALGRFTNYNGDALGADASQIAEMWVLSAADFAAFVGSGRDVATLNANNRLFATETDTGSFDLSGYDAGMFGDEAAGTFDELRYGTSAASVTPVPEPASLAGLLVAGAALVARRGRRHA